MSKCTTIGREWFPKFWHKNILEKREGEGRNRGKEEEEVEEGERRGEQRRGRRRGEGGGGGGGRGRGGSGGEKSTCQNGHILEPFCQAKCLS